MNNIYYIKCVSNVESNYNINSIILIYNIVPNTA